MAREFKKIKILFTIPNFDTAGSGKALLKIAKQLDSTVFEPHILCMHNRGAFFKVVEASGIPVHIFQYTTVMKPYTKGVLNCFKIAKMFRSIAPDIIHSFHYSADYSEPLAAKIAGIKWLYTKKNMNWGGSSKNSWNLRTWLADHIIYQNTDMKTMFFPKTNNTSLISRGVDVSEFFPFETNATLLDKYALSKEDRIIITVANLVPLKGIDVLIKAFHTADLAAKQWKLLIVGDKNNAHGIELQELVTSLKIEKQVVFSGKVLNVNEHLNLAELFVLPTLFKGEGSPVALLEAMATGLCVLGSDLPGIKDQLIHTPEHLVTAGNVEMWAEVLRKFCQHDKEGLKAMGNNFLKHIKASYTLNKEVEQTENVYLKIV